MNLEITQENGAGQRLDVFLAAELPECSRSRIQTLIHEGQILVNGRTTKPKKKLKTGHRLDVTLPEPVDTALVPQDLPLEVLYEDADVIVINKASGMVVHPAAGNPDETVVNALLHHCGEQKLSHAGDPMRPGIVHRLDKDTSGCLVAAKNDAAHEHLVKQFSDRKVTKEYLAVVEGCPAELSGRLVNHIGRNPANRLKMALVEPPAGKAAITEYDVLEQREHCALVRCRLLTGRTHQIRVHLQSLGTPILGDEVYARPARQKEQPGRLMLHAWKLGFIHPRTKQPFAVSSEIPEAFSPYLPPTL